MAARWSQEARHAVAGIARRSLSFMESRVKQLQKRFGETHTLRSAGIMLSIATLAALQIQNPSNSSGQAADAATYGYRVVHAYPHDAAAYTQGLLYRDGFLFESTGLNGRSTLRKVRLNQAK